MKKKKSKHQVHKILTAKILCPRSPAGLIFKIPKLLLCVHYLGKSSKLK